MNQYPVMVSRVIDGDTVVGQIDLGFGILVDKHIRLAGINAHAVNTQAGEQAKQYLFEKVQSQRVTLEIDPDHSTEKFGRVLGTLWVGDVNINAQMVLLHFAVPYDGKTPHDAIDAPVAA